VNLRFRVTDLAGNVSAIYNRRYSAR